MKLKPLTYKEFKQFRAIQTPEDNDKVIDEIFASRDIDPDEMSANKVQHIIQELVKQALEGKADEPDFLEFS